MTLADFLREDLNLTARISGVNMEYAGLHYPL